MALENEDQTGQVEVDPWAAAFAALDKAGKGDAEEPAAGGADAPAAVAGGVADTAGAGAGEPVPPDAPAGNGEPDAPDLGGLGASPGSDGAEDATAFGGMQGIDVEKYEQDLKDSIRDRAIGDIAKEFIKRGIRNNNGKLGATIDDKDICKRDEDGVPHFYNPETGQEFRSDNPRRQAQEWVDDYNRELKRVFNDTCEKYEKHLMEEQAPSIAVMKFAPKYEKLDEIRKGMFDNVIEDYEIKDGDGKVIGYSCDLDKALALVERQIAHIQSYAKKQQEAQPAPPTGPALDMKTSSGAIASGERKVPKSLAEAMEMQQDELLEKMRKGR